MKKYIIQSHKKKSKVITKTTASVTKSYVNRVLCTKFNCYDKFTNMKYLDIWFKIVLKGTFEWLCKSCLWYSLSWELVCFMRLLTNLKFILFLGIWNLIIEIGLLMSFSGFRLHSQSPVFIFWKIALVITINYIGVAFTSTVKGSLVSKCPWVKSIYVLFCQEMYRIFIFQYCISVVKYASFCLFVGLS